MKKLIGQITIGDKVFVRVGGSKFKSACEVKEINVSNIGEETETATMLLDDGVNKYRQNWYTIESIEVIS
jgi:hypothetical protein